MPAAPVIIVTGGSRGLGLAVIRCLLERYDARVSTISRSSPPELQAVVRQYGSDRILAITGDVGKPETNAELVSKTVERWGRLDGVVANANSMVEFQRLADISPESMQSFTTTNLFSALYLVQPALPHLRKSRGQIVLVSSGAATKGYVSWGLYNMSKAALNSLGRTLAAEEKDVGVFAVRPGVIDTQMQLGIREDGKAAMDPDEHARYVQLHTSGHLLQPAVPAAVLAGLAVEGSHELSGEFFDWADERVKKYQTA